MKSSSTGLIIAPVSESVPKTSELFASAAPVPFVYLPNQQAARQYVDAFPLENQIATNSCVAHDRALSYAIYRSLTTGQPYVQPSPAFIYFYRSNSPGPGMIPDDANTITEDRGIPDYADYPTPTGGDPSIDNTPPDPSVRMAALENTIKAWLTADVTNDIDVIAGACNGVGVPVGILIFATIAEWSLETPIIQDPSLTVENAPVAHCVTVLPQSAYRDATTGKRYVIIQESAFFGGFHYRYISEDWIRVRCRRIDYIADLQTSIASALTPHTFTTDLTVGSTGPEVVALQTALQQLGFFPTLLNGQTFQPTGQYYGVTKKAVLDFQNAYMDEILAPSGLTAGTGYFGPATRNQLNKILNA